MSDGSEQQTTAAGNGDVQTNPDELGKLVETLLENMQGKFQQMSDQIIGRLDEMGQRVDDLEKNITELMEQLETKEDVSNKKEK